MKTWKASMDGFTRMITVFVLALILGMMTFQFLLIRETAGWVKGLISLFGLAVIVGLYLFRPLNYQTNTEELIIRRWVASVSIPRSSIREILPIDRPALRGSLRLFGVGGVFGYFGRFYNRKMGVMTWYLTRRDRTVLLKVDEDRIILISPDERDGFIRAMTHERGT